MTVHAHHWYVPLEP